MKSEKVKDIKKALEWQRESLAYLKNNVVELVSCKDILTYINELESENELYKQSCGAIGQNSLTIINQLKDRIAELEEYIKGNEADAKDFVNGWNKDLQTELTRFAERLIETFNDTEYRAKTKRKTISVEELKAQMDWILHEVVIKNIGETLKEFVGLEE